MFETELQFFVANQDTLVKQYQGKVLVLRGHEVVAAHETLLEAYLDAQRRFEAGSFMLQPCEAGPDAFTVTVSTAGLVAAASRA
jgi:hypothetical protein